MARDKRDGPWPTGYLHRTDRHRRRRGTIGSGDLPLPSVVEETIKARAPDDADGRSILAVHPSSLAVNVEMTGSKEQ
jgi:hypothetical protein